MNKGHSRILVEAQVAADFAGAATAVLVAATVVGGASRSESQGDYQEEARREPRRPHASSFFGRGNPTPFVQEFGFNWAPYPRTVLLCVVYIGGVALPSACGPS